MAIEYIIWGVPPKNKHLEQWEQEEVLATGFTSEGEADRTIGVLQDFYDCKDMRIQALDLDKKPDFIKAIKA